MYRFGRLRGLLAWAGSIAIAVVAAGTATAQRAREDDSGRRKRALDEAVEEREVDLDEFDGEANRDEEREEREERRERAGTRSSSGSDRKPGWQEEESSPSEGTADLWPGLIARERQLVVWGMLEIALNAQKRAGLVTVGGAFQPTALAPDGWYGFSGALSFGVVHSEYGQTGFWGGQGDGLCFTGSSSGCAAAYSRLGALARYRLYREGQAELAADGGILVRQTDPFALALKVGVVGRYLLSPSVFLEGGASLLVGISNREVNGVPLNKELFSLPVALLYQVGSDAVIFGQTGLSAFVENLGDTVRIPLSVGGYYSFNASFAGAAVFSLPGLIAGSGILFDGFAGRTMTLVLVYRN
jgi:hypothetical protein